MKNTTTKSPCQEELKKAPDFSGALDHDSNENLKFGVNEKYPIGNPLSSGKLNRSKMSKNTTVFLCAIKYKSLHRIKAKYCPQNKHFPEAKNHLEKITLYLLKSLYEITSPNILFLRYIQSQYLYRFIDNNKYKDFNLSFIYKLLKIKHLFKYCEKKNMLLLSKSIAISIKQCFNEVKQIFNKVNSNYSEKIMS